MLQSAWLFIGLIAILTTGIAVSTRTRFVGVYEQSNSVAITSGIAGFISWMYLAYGSLDVVIVGDSVTYSFSMPAVTIFAIMMGIIPGLIALTGPANLIESRVRNPNSRDI